jgi:DNA-binding CsgD family transcriptional regulator
MIERLESLARRARIDVSVPQSTIEPAAGRDLLNGLTRRESQVLRLLVQGRSNAEIARELFITIKTVSVHITNIKAKFGARSRVEIAGMAIRLGLG